MPAQVDILGIKIDRINLTEALQRISETLETGSQMMVVTANPEIVMLARKDKEFATVLEQAGLVTADGIGLVIASKILGTPLGSRVTGIDLVQGMFLAAAKKGHKFYFLGAREEVVAKAAANVRERYPQVQVAGYHHGYFRGREEEVLEDIKRAAPDILLVALGMGIQEKWIHQNQARLGIPVAIGVGGSFDVLAGVVKRAPRWMQQLGLEWLYRLLNQPSRFVRMLELPKFLMLVVAKKLGFKL